MSLGIFIFGMAVFAIVGAACWLIAASCCSTRLRLVTTSATPRRTCWSSVVWVR